MNTMLITPAVFIWFASGVLAVYHFHKKANERAWLMPLALILGPFTWVFEAVYHRPLRRKPERDPTSVTPDSMQPAEGYMRALMTVSSRWDGMAGEVR